MRKNCIQGVETKGLSAGYESESCSEKTEDSSSSSLQPHLLKTVQHTVFAFSGSLTPQIDKFNRISASTFSSDKLIRLVGSLIKLFKNFDFLQHKGQLDKLGGQIGQLRRLLRLNRLGMNIKNYSNFVVKEKKGSRDIFDFLFQGLMLGCDSLDTLAYLMQLRVIEEKDLQFLRKWVANFYFYECVVWTLLHAYELLTKKEYGKLNKQCLKKMLNIVKYVLDSITSHNDFSGRKLTLGTKTTTIIGLISSLIGMILVWM